MEMSIAPGRSKPLSRLDTGFNDRLAYVRWLRARGRIGPETDRELAATTGVGEQWLYKWKSRVDAPNTRTIAEQLCRGLNVDPGWLLDGNGAPPEPELWKRWLDGPTTAPQLRVAEPVVTYYQDPRPTKPAKRRGKKRPR